MCKKIVSFGEIMLRLTAPSKQLLKEAKTLEVCYGGSESNVLVSLSNFGEKTQFLTALPTDSLGDAVMNHLRCNGVGTDFIIRQGDSLGMYFLEEGFDARTSNVIYKRKDSEVSKLAVGAFDYDEIFKDCSLFHICGISFALSECTRELCFDLLKQAKKRGIKISFDFNYRGKLWSVSEASSVYKEIIPYVDILFCSELDLKVFLETDVDGIYDDYGVEIIIVRQRKVLSGYRHSVSVAGYNNGIGVYESEETEFSVMERIGSGDAFTAGVLYVLNEDIKNLDYALKFGVGCFILKHTQKGDVFTLDKSLVESYINNLSKDVVR